VSVTGVPDTTAPDEVAAITAALQGFVPVLEDPDPRQRAYIYTEDATFAMPGAPLLQGRGGDASPTGEGHAASLGDDHAFDNRGARDLAYAYGLFTCIQDERPVTLHFLMVLRKEADGTWRIAREFLAAESPTP
jgi:ketosteroid isomerase-like protein